MCNTEARTLAGICLKKCGLDAMKPRTKSVAAGLCHRVLRNWIQQFRKGERVARRTAGFLIWMEVSLTENEKPSCWQSWQAERKPGSCDVWKNNTLRREILGLLVYSWRPEPRMWVDETLYTGSTEVGKEGSTGTCAEQGHVWECILQAVPLTHGYFYFKRISVSILLINNLEWFILS